jgi:Family of unknown function (DUF5995)
MESLSRPPFSPVPARMTRWLHRLDAGGDRRALYLRDYALSLCNVVSALESGRIADTDWSLGLLDLFSDYYFATLEAVHPFPTQRPPAWEVAHRLALDPAARCEEVLMLALNAHINNDLPQALATCFDREWPMSPQELRLRREDFWRITDVIAETPHEGSGAWVPGALVLRWRSDAWDTALALLTAPTARWQAAICEDLEHAALKRAHMIACIGVCGEAVLSLSTQDLHGIFDRYRCGACRCGIESAACDSWMTNSA